MPPVVYNYTLICFLFCCPPGTCTYSVLFTGLALPLIIVARFPRAVLDGACFRPWYLVFPVGCHLQHCVSGTGS
ncbi:hypothetical protein B0T22DRAFT_456284 [Podospora appendiculata]|uniref:Uncharacterized protein n=1 Tax=Podospora appendiculata TaxID=314037 RepID=A0AAE0XLZ3_9PEZI|nr:hypothetical protein B0T22DRAFT_456284 [Podospora appendiculata]